MTEVAVVLVAVIALVGWRWWLDVSLRRMEHVAKSDEARLRDIEAAARALDGRVKDLEYARMAKRG